MTLHFCISISPSLPLSLHVPLSVPFHHSISPPALPLSSLCPPAPSLLCPFISSVPLSPSPRCPSLYRSICPSLSSPTPSLHPSPTLPSPLLYPPSVPSSPLCFPPPVSLCPFLYPSICLPLSLLPPSLRSAPSLHLSIPPQSLYSPLCLRLCLCHFVSSSAPLFVPLSILSAPLPVMAGLPPLSSPLSGC